MTPMVVQQNYRKARFDRELNIEPFLAATDRCFVAFRLLPSINVLSLLDGDIVTRRGM